MRDNSLRFFVWEDCDLEELASFNELTRKTFWLDSSYKNNIYYLPECEAYVVGAVERDKLYLYQIIGKGKVEPERVARAFGDGFYEVVLDFTPAHKEGLSVRVHKKEDCTLFIIGQDLTCVSEKRMMFSILSHA